MPATHHLRYLRIFFCLSIFMCLMQVADGQIINNTPDTIVAQTTDDFLAYAISQREVDVDIIPAGTDFSDSEFDWEVEAGPQGSANFGSARTNGSLRSGVTVVGFSCFSRIFAEATGSQRIIFPQRLNGAGNDFPPFFSPTMAEYTYTNNTQGIRFMTLNAQLSGEASYSGSGNRPSASADIDVDFSNMYLPPTGGNVSISKTDADEDLSCLETRALILFPGDSITVTITSATEVSAGTGTGGFSRSFIVARVDATVDP